MCGICVFFFSSRRRHTRYWRDWSSDVCSSDLHGSPLGEEEIKLTKQAYGWPSEEPFHVPDEALAHFREAVDRGRALEAAWRARLEAHPERPQPERPFARPLPAGPGARVPAQGPAAGLVATPQAPKLRKT